MHKRLPSRRDAIATTAATLASLTILPRHVLGAPGKKSANERLNLAFIGVGGRGGANLNKLSVENVVALCDVDENRAAAAMKQHPQAKSYRDFRKMLDELEKSLDGVVVSTPDHTHAVALMAAIRRGKHVYSEKPLAHSIHEVRELMKAARERKVTTQLGNQGHSWESTAIFCEWIRAGVIGGVHTIHAVAGYGYSRIRDLARLSEQHPVPPTLDWDLWLGPAPLRPYNPVYLPGRWRGWMPFGTGAIGDWVCHVVDPVYFALDLGAPTTIQARVKDYDPKVQGDTFPPGVCIRYEFPARAGRGPVTLFWYDGTEKPPLPPELQDDKNLSGRGAVVMGDKGIITYASHGAITPALYPAEKMKDLRRPGKTDWESSAHHDNWLDAVRSGKPAASNFDYGGPLTEIVLLGIIAMRLPDQKLEWNSQAGRFTNNAEANQLLAQPYRSGWTL